MLIPRPPQIPAYNIRHSTILRFVSNAAVNQNITIQNLLDTILFATTAIAGSDVFKFVKIRRINMWALGTLGTTEFITVDFSGSGTGAAGDNKIHTASSMGIEPATISAKPSPKSLISNFQFASGSTAFNLDVPSGTVIDLHMTFLASFAGSATAAQNALVAATPGTILLRGLDGLAIATTLLPPVLAPDAI